MLKMVANLLYIAVFKRTASVTYLTYIYEQLISIDIYINKTQSHTKIQQEKMLSKKLKFNALKL